MGCCTTPRRHTRGRHVLLLGALAAFLAAGCEADRPGPTRAAAPAADATTPATPVETDTHAIHNLHQLNDRIYSGSSPEDDKGFDELQRLGVKTIITVDGAAPDVDKAAARGIRYIHLPIGYDQVPEDKAVLLAQAMKQTEGKVFVHCHHGKHRGPAAAAVCAIADEGWSNQKAIAWLRQAGTSADYPGLYKSVETFRPPDAAVLARPADLPQRAAVPALAAAMVMVDERWEHLAASRRAKFTVPPQSPDIDPPHEALQLAELYREIARSPEARKRGDDFIARLTEADANAMTLHELLKSFKAAPTDMLFKQAEEAATLVGSNCKACHVRYRD